MPNANNGVPEFPFELSGFASGGAILWTVFALFLALYVIVSAVLVYHWNRYGLGSRTIFFAQAVFFVVSIFLFAGTIISILAL